MKEHLKKLFSIALVLVMVFALTACGSQDAGGNDPSPSSSAPPSSTPPSGDKVQTIGVHADEITPEME